MQLQKERNKGLDIKNLCQIALGIIILWSADTECKL